jgi:hypothetical protein
MTIHKEAIAARASCNKQGREGEHMNVLQFRAGGLGQIAVGREGVAFRPCAPRLLRPFLSAG